MWQSLRAVLIVLVVGGVMWQAFFADHTPEAPRAEVVSVRVAPFVTAQGARSSMIYVDWRNAGSRPIRTLKANLSAYDAGGRPIYDASDYVVYAASDTQPGVTPGQTHLQREGEGHVVSVPSIAVRATASITEVKEENGYF